MSEPKNKEILECLLKTLTINFNKECFKLLLLKGLSLFVLMSSLTRKIPQIKEMYRTKEIKGLSCFSLYLDLISGLIEVMYPIYMGYTFFIYGENVFSLFQNLIVFLLVVIYDKEKKNKKKNIIFFVIFCLLFFLFYLRIFNEYWMIILNNGSNGLSLISKFAQISNSYKEKTTGPLSAIAYLLNVIVNLIRVVTIYIESRDFSMTSGNAMCFLLNSVIYGQILYYNKNAKKINNKNKKIE